MRRARGIGLAVLLIATLSCAGCGTDRGFDDQVIAVLQDTGRSRLTIRELGAPAGGEFLVVCPYETADSVEQRLGFVWSDAPDLRETDALQALITLDEDHDVASFTTFSRSRVDFCSEGRMWNLVPNEEELEVVDSSTTLEVLLPPQ
ncbi:hypothetical protein SCB71_20360 [Herbiconiux sp. KACC 21604]|uniref:hypothetical protein n=1 Tax=unclassified Herbiconiux TaxID=2618217 RepID=UPI001492B593|nr:hypothetical protein [Herbiconiux sp. SALV-R1]QJU55377.1 hypothetical protein HL652_18285 [Herbiconiux sp. SALV-R1]WPO86549.1 hypothetical protein SCB71_20360 [Herbiconiux sp. KACC 21604]